MDGIMGFAAIMAVCLGCYLLAALLKPEWFL